MNEDLRKLVDDVVSDVDALVLHVARKQFEGIVAHIESRRWREADVAVLALRNTLVNAESMASFAKCAADTIK